MSRSQSNRRGPTKADIELRLIHDGERWIARNDRLTAEGEALSDLDSDVRRALQEGGKYPAGSRLTVFMGFDFDTFPTWLRQYHAHYFNRVVSMDTVNDLDVSEK
uniref:Uncharacterized protein n=1 Tax=Candidatus Kentrum eta TaxID=2126337 RepID=A0A450VIT5_9GAMM|nr:MAG: hypothetical protein BECKH772A_GA0070896_102032 [Candidatus Kentron sp. H]VFK02265.1 MAG: hypothetical protein BECKH772B_GA0070898_102702 [Candidatus Kentron sp. H]VFK04712.1 MAG: hypothetical protein BECKH772C_GA0070978_102012 [Candidatus Kentron sp. H]